MPTALKQRIRTGIVEGASRFRGKPVSFNDAFNVLSQQFLYELAQELESRLTQGGWEIRPNPTSVYLINTSAHLVITLEMVPGLPFRVEVNEGDSRFRIAAADVKWTATKIAEKLVQATVG